MEIYELKLKSSKNSNVFVAKTSEGEFFLHSEIIVKNGINKGIINDNIFKIAVEESEKMIALNLALKYVGSRLKTEKQIKDYLYKKDFRSNTVNAVIEKLREYGVIDDENFAESYVKANPNYSKNKLKQKLASKGVKSDLRVKITTDLDEGESCLNNAKKYLRNKEISKETTEKLIRNLQGKGYSWDTISSVLRKITKEDFENF